MNSLTTLICCRRNLFSQVPLCLATLLLCLSATAIAAPLTQAEKNQAVALVLTLPWAATTPNAQPAQSRFRTHELGEQTISVEIDIKKGDTDNRHVRVYQFSYHTASARVSVVSLDSQSIISVTPIDSVHLPLNAAETDVALAWLAGDTNTLEILRADQVRRGFKPFEQLAELAVKASIFKPIDNTHECAKQRCALLSLFDKNNTVFAMEPIINLQRGTLSWMDR